MALRQEIISKISLILIVSIFQGMLSEATDKIGENSAVASDTKSSRFSATLSRTENTYAASIITVTTSSLRITSSISKAATKSVHDETRSITASAVTVTSSVSQKSPGSGGDSDEENVSMMVFIYVFIAASVFILAFFVYRAVTGKMKRKTKRYGVIAGVDMEMAPLGPTDDDDDDTTVFEVRRSRRH
ncbi:hypothetical protein TrispH2_003019 [Trichoplax sp. H2]|nr:hypothetical protein TrispH2_003019 [Trichoplax sp. H2]|eukprot:RDD44373.1 hypothetical protein TrispH2_003019 [Trichoplax sp. H2]